MKKIILLRHGQSKWNLENRFTGWKDIGLTPAGEKEAAFAGYQLVNNNVQIGSVYTSILKRAIETANIVTKIIGFLQTDIQDDWRLNERHYGALQGLNISETASKYGEDQVHIWRRSFDIPPPLLSNNDPRHPRFNKKFQSIQEDLPVGESLSDVINRLQPFWEDYMQDIQKSRKNDLIVAHSNSLRAIVKILDKLSKDEIMSVNIPTGVPLVYTLDKNLGVVSKEYLIDKNELKIRQEIVANQGKKK